MRKDQLFGPGGFDPDHPSGNVLDEFVHDDPDDPSKGVTVKHYDADGKAVVDRALTKDEVVVFFSGLPHEDHDAINEMANEFVNERTDHVPE